jgi:hypothetical protein
MNAVVKIVFILILREDVVFVGSIPRVGAGVPIAREGLAAMIQRD